MKDPFCKDEVIDNPVFEKMVNRARYAPLAGLSTKRVPKPTPAPKPKPKSKPKPKPKRA